MAPNTSWPGPDGEDVPVKHVDSVPSPAPVDAYDETPMSSADIGTIVWCVMPGEPFEMCLDCGAPGARCEHTQRWALVELPGIFSGPLRAMKADHERSAVVYTIDDIGTVQPLSVHRTLKLARAAVYAEFSDELGLLVAWATMA